MAERGMRNEGNERVVEIFTATRSPRKYPRIFMPLAVSVDVSSTCFFDRFFIFIFSPTVSHRLIIPTYRLPCLFRWLTFVSCPYPMNLTIHVVNLIFMVVTLFFFYSSSKSHISVLPFFFLSFFFVTDEALPTSTRLLLCTASQLRKQAMWLI